MICADCRSEILAAWNYCPQCGMPTAVVEDVAEATRGAFAERRAVSLEALFDHLSTPTLFVTARRRIGHINRAACALLDIDLSPKPVGKPFEEVVHRPEFVTLVRRLLEEGARTADEQREEEIAIRQGDVERFYQVHSSPLYDGIGTPLGTMFLFQEITDLRQEARMQEEFMSVVAYGVRWPLTPIKGFVRTLIEDENEEWYDRETRREFYAILDENVDRLLNNVGDLTTFSKIERWGVEAIEVNWSIFDLREVAHTVLANPPRRAEKYTFQLDFEPDTMDMEADRDSIQRILHRLIDDIRYSPNGGEVRIIARLLPPDGAFTCDTVEVGVWELGQGIIPGYATRPITMFVHPPPHRPRKVGATGIGDSIIQALIAAHRGETKMEGEPETGSTFWFRIPLRQPELKTAASE